jgi:pyruvate,orthophosphate dikinase
MAARRKKASRTRAHQRCYHFGPSRTDGRASDKALLGGKGANLAEMTSIGLPVPPGFTITTACCEEFQALGALPGGLVAEMRKHIATLERETGKSFGKGRDPLLLSVRSGAAVSMPGMMDTVLNLGLSDDVVAALAEHDERFAYDAYRRLINMFGDVVMRVAHEHFEKAFDRIKKRYHAKLDSEVPATGLRELCGAYLKIYKRRVGEDFPQDPHEQLERAIVAVFESWDGARAVAYRRIRRIEHLRGTAVNVQAMVYGNRGEHSATGVAFTRDPATGERALYGEFLVDAQGEDVVAGIRTPLPIAELRDFDAKLYAQLQKVRDKLEKHFRDMQDLEFTIERGTLYILQTRSGKRTGAAAVKTAVDMVRERLIDRQTAVRRVSPDDVMQLLLPRFTPQRWRVDVACRSSWASCCSRAASTPTRSRACAPSP